MTQEVFILLVGLVLQTIAFIGWRILKYLKTEDTSAAYAVPVFLMVIGLIFMGIGIALIVSAYADTLPSLKEVLKR